MLCYFQGCCLPLAISAAFLPALLQTSIIEGGASGAATEAGVEAGVEPDTLLNFAITVLRESLSIICISDALNSAKSPNDITIKNRGVAT